MFLLALIVDYYNLWYFIKKKKKKHKRTKKKKLNPTSTKLGDQEEY
jgi:hypothetical protein